ncbi:ABC transporter ATP-binding protein [Anaerosphaera multitolerans]|uniref:ABC transporter ATP-binding protein n=1 Tax=Anaerosphaera multitolerans TaxID=2487351 RepID=A0A437S627_9FIRM|nr:ABC transporter ATP-binding protein [Anaerosphaera multitolerans]RVU54427.1 ABC transporter ATP-binding protein [Anaerosphaera multitolerans]
MKKLKVFFNLLKIVKPLIKVMCFAIFFGSLGNLLAMTIPTFGAYKIIKIATGKNINIKLCLIVLITCGVFRAIFKYLEQLCNHYVAFKTLYIIRDQVFLSMRRLSPAKLDRKDSGDLISLITSDIELLEVFYAHTISPIVIAIICEIVLIYTLYLCSPFYSILLFVFHIIIGILIPFIIFFRTKDIGNIQRRKISKLNTSLYENVNGILELVQFNSYDLKNKEVIEISEDLFDTSIELSKFAGVNFSMSTFIITICNLFTLLLSVKLFISGNVELDRVVVGCILIISSFGPVLSLSNLANDLSMVFACANRVLSIINEEPIVEENKDGSEVEYNDLKVEDLKFGYTDRNILENISLNGSEKGILGIFGKSGSGKSTLLKLIMRFYDINSGKILINNIDIKNIKSSSLRKNEAYLTQKTYLFNDTIEENIKIAKINAEFHEVVEACKKASIHDFIINLPNGYKTIVKKDSLNLSTGEAQRIGMARVFLHNAKLCLLDEPTSNIDSLNEGIILNSIKKQSRDRFFILVSHRKSTLGISDEIYYL